jgi:hypothetical protein
MNVELAKDSSISLREVKQLTNLNLDLYNKKIGDEGVSALH